MSLVQDKIKNCRYTIAGVSIRILDVSYKTATSVRAIHIFTYLCTVVDAERTLINFCNNTHQKKHDKKPTPSHKLKKYHPDL